MSDLKNWSDFLPFFNTLVCNISYIYAPLRRRRGILRYTCRSVCQYVGRFVGMSVSLNLVQLITQEPFAPEASNFESR